MPTTTIKASYINPKEKGPSNIKAEDGKYYKVFTYGQHRMDFSQFKQDGTYEIEYEEGSYQGKPTYTVTKVLSSSTSQSTNGNGHHDASAMYRPGTASNEQKWGCSLKCASLLLAGAGADKVDVLMEVARFIYNEPIDIVDEAKKLFNATEAQ